MVSGRIRLFDFKTYVLNHYPLDSMYRPCWFIHVPVHARLLPLEYILSPSKSCHNTLYLSLSYSFFTVLQLFAYISLILEFVLFEVRDFVIFIFESPLWRVERKDREEICHSSQGIREFPEGWWKSVVSDVTERSSLALSFSDFSKNFFLFVFF